MSKVFFGNYSKISSVQELQKEIRKNSEAGQGYAFITFMGENWQWGEIRARLTMSGAPEWAELTFRDFDELIRHLEYINNIAIFRNYDNG